MDISPYDAWAEIYDSVFSYVVDDIPFYVEEATRAGGRVLELGCGTGRVSIPMAQAGIDVVGIDSSSTMLTRAREKSQKAGTQNLNLLCADMRDFNISSKFDLVIIPFRGLLSLLSVDDQIRTLMNIKRHLEPGGKLIFDIFVPDLNMMVQEGDVPYHFRDVTDMETGNRLIIWNQANYDAFSQGHGRSHYYRAARRFGARVEQDVSRLCATIHLFDGKCTICLVCADMTCMRCTATSSAVNSVRTARK